MKKIISLAAVALMATSAFADSYTLSFKDSGAEKDSAKTIPVDWEVENVLADGADLVSAIKAGPLASGTRTYLAKQGYGLKFGSSSQPGNLVLKLAAKGQVEADSIRIKASKYAADEEVNLTVNGFAATLASKSLEDYLIKFEEPQAIDTLFLSSDGKRFYATEVEVFYTAPETAFDADMAHAPVYTAGKTFEVVLGPDMLGSGIKTNAETGEQQTKPCIAHRFQWIQYINPTSSLDDGCAEVQQANRWTNYDPNYADYNYGEGANWIQVTGNNGSKNAPVLSAAWGKYMVFFVKQTTKVSILGIGSAGGSAADGNCLRAVAVASDNSEVIECNSTPGGIYGKGTASDTLNITLDPEKAYMITLKGDETAQKDIQIGGIQLYGVLEDEGFAPKTTNASFAYWDVVTGPDMITKGGTKVKTNAETGEVQDKWGVKDELEWIVYINPTSVLDDGTAEVQTSNRWTDLNPRTGVRGEWLQVAGKDGDVNAPVLSPAWGKYMAFYVSGTKLFTAYGAGSASGSADDGNCLKVTAYPANSNDSIVVTSTPGGIYGKGTASDCVAVELDEAETYIIKVEAAVKDIQLTGINLINAEGLANLESGKGTLNIAVEKAAAGDVIDLDGETWTLIGEAATDYKGLLIQNGKIVADTLGQITTKQSLVLDQVSIKSVIAPIAMAAKESLTAADTLAIYSEIVVGYDTVIASVDTTYAEDGTIAAVDTTYAYNPVMGMKYQNAANKVFEAELIAIRRSIIDTESSFINGGNAPWALRSLVIDESELHTSANSGKAFLNWEEGASQIKDIVITNSLLYADSVNTAQRFHRYSSQVDPWRVWGYEGEDKNQPGLNTWTLTNNTFINLCGNKEFSNNIKNTAATTFTFKGNVFANCWRLQKLGSNVTREFEATDNVICGGYNTVDATDASKWATEDPDMDVTVESPYPCPLSATAYIGYGCPDYRVDFLNLSADATAQFNTEVDGAWYFQVAFPAADSLVVAEDAALPIISAAGDTLFTVTAPMFAVEGTTATVSVPAIAQQFITPGEYTISIPVGSFVLYSYAVGCDHCQPSLIGDQQFTIDEPVGIEEIATEVATFATKYNVAGQRVQRAAGLTVVDGKVQYVK